MPHFFTMIGSRETPELKCELLIGLARVYTEAGWVGRSGGASGADSCLQLGAVGKQTEIYLPWNGFNGFHFDEETFLEPSWEHSNKACKVASETHPAWGNVKLGARKMHTRNVFQVLGRCLDNPSECVICYAKPFGNKGYVQGGTATAVKIAVDRGIPVFNLWYEDAYDKALEFLNVQEGNRKCLV